MFSSPLRMYRKSCLTTVGIDGGGGGSVSNSVAVNKMLKLYIKVFVCDDQSTVRQAGPSCSKHG